MKQMELIAEKVSETFGVDIKKNIRSRIYINARACFYHLCASYVKPKPSLECLGGYVGRDHATALHALRKRLIYIKNDKAENLHREAENKVSELFGNKPKGRPVHEQIISGLRKEITILKKENEILKKKIQVNVPDEILQMLITLDNEDIREFCDTRVRVFVQMKLNDKKRLHKFYGHILEHKQVG